MLSRRFVAGLALLAVVVGFASYYVPAAAAVPLRVVAGGIGIAVALYNFWRAMMEKSG
jgi:hypothetical protein